MKPAALNLTERSHSGQHWRATGYRSCRRRRSLLTRAQMHPNPGSRRVRLRWRRCQKSKQVKKKKNQQQKKDDSLLAATLSKKKKKRKKSSVWQNLVLQTLSMRLILADALTGASQRFHLICGSSLFHRTKRKEKGDALKNGRPKMSHISRS